MLNLVYASFKIIFGITFLAIALIVASVEAADFPGRRSLEELGRTLFFDTNLSKHRTQSCATCHSPDHAFIDPRINASGRAVSLGDDGRSLRDRNTPTLSYSAFSPSFTLNEEGVYVGGQFLDGRAKDLVEQATQPILSVSEMGMPSEESVVQRVKENPLYVKKFTQHFGERVFYNTDQAFHALAESIAVFEKTEEFAPFDSKSDRHLRGEYEMTNAEELGMTLFFSQQFTSCNICHQLKPIPSQEGETFTNYQYHNIGVPVNLKARKVNGVAADHVDQGLLDHPMINDMKQAGKFKVPTLRNVAVTAPYMHNGVFEELRTVILFYNKYNSKSKKRQINPETSEPWRAPEVPENLSLEELQTGPALDDRRINALLAFLKTLTDKRYEYLLED
ncbi:MAG: cytochrome c peroxidase [Gammaproteobacteria bacterium]